MDKRREKNPSSHLHGICSCPMDDNNNNNENPKIRLHHIGDTPERAGFVVIIIIHRYTG